ncbi:unnamed protein product [Mytilus coruscus]|uniref:Uncharacterized protein n=1 Tax=Mytilus coruscus TaxID=42192 RepID=A0A6J8E3A8_MYTCO|nr:unnamed protein product [Mytilus coruscus]
MVNILTWSVLTLQAIFVVCQFPPLHRLSRWQRFRNGHPVFPQHAARQALQRNPWPINVEANVGNQPAENDEIDSDIIAFDDPSAGLDEFLEGLFEDVDMDSEESQSTNVQSNSVRIRSGSGDIQHNRDDGAISLSDIAQNAKLEHELLFGGLLKDISGTGVRSHRGSIVNIPARQTSLSEQIRMQVRQMQTQQPTSSHVRQPIRIASPFNSQGNQRVLALPLQTRLMNQNFEGGGHTRNMLRNEQRPRHTLLVLVNNTKLDTSTVRRGPNTGLFSTRTLIINRFNNNNHISRSNLRFSTRNSTRSITSRNNFQNSARQPLQPRQAATQQPSQAIGGSARMLSVNDQRQRQNVLLSQTRNNLQPQSAANNVPSTHTGRNMVNSVFLANQRRPQRITLNTPNSMNNNRVVPESQRQNLNRIMANRFLITNTRNAEDTPGITQQQVVANRLNHQRRLVAERMSSERPGMQRQFAQFIRDSTDVPTRPPPFQGGPGQFPPWFRSQMNFPRPNFPVNHQRGPPAPFSQFQAPPFFL